jgi:hypothetical protein
LLIREGLGMAEFPADATPWLAVIGRSLAHLCLEQEKQREPNKFKDVLPKVDFLMAMGLTEKDAAEVAGTNHKSVRDLRAYYSKKKANGKAQKKRRL